MKRVDKRTGRLLLLFFGCCAGLFVLSLCTGRYRLTLPQLLAGEPMAVRVFFTLRLPRTVMATVAGFGLAVAGSVYQTVFKNALAAPDIIGVSSGAGTGAAAAILFFGGGTLAVSLCAFFGGLLAVGIALLMAGASRQRQLATFVLSGIAVNALMQAILMTLKLLADPERQLASIEFWTMGSLAGITASKLPVVLVLVALGLCGIFLLYRQILLLTMDDGEARMMGVPVHRMRRIVLLLATMVVAAIVSVTGLISFIGLIAPHLARLLTRNSRSATALLGGLIGSALLLLADCASRSLFGAELPISILTSVLGAPFLLYLVCREERVP